LRIADRIAELRHALPILLVQMHATNGMSIATRSHGQPFRQAALKPAQLREVVGQTKPSVVRSHADSRVEGSIANEELYAKRTRNVTRILSQVGSAIYIIGNCF